MMKPNEPKMPLDDARWWAEALAENLMDAKYAVAKDDETHFKIAAVRRLIERNEELENALSTTYAAIEILGKVL